MHARGSAGVVSNPILPNFYSRLTAALCIICWVTTGCALIKLRNEHTESLASTVLVGRISTASPGKGPIVVAAYTLQQGKREVADYTLLHDFGEYEIMVSNGNYYVFAYLDNNSNFIYDEGEPAGQFGNPKMVFAPAGGVVGGIDISIPEIAQRIAVPPGFDVASANPKKRHSRLAGAIVELDDELFLEENGTKGYWEPTSFFKELGGNIYFIEAYDPQKIPILFIHGATGTPKGWQYFVDNIDRTRFQPWFFYYPSGARLQGMSHLLLWKLENLKLKYNFEQLYITAHSMGGLVARSFLMDHSARFPYVKLFVSLATPWGGVRSAEYGVKQSPAVVPCWIDMQPESAFLQSLYRSKMPETVSFYMFFGHQGSRNPLRSNNDRTIAFSSLLDRRAQSEAKMNYAFNADHVSILDSKAVLDQYNAIINTLSNPTGGYLKIDFAYPPYVDGARPDPTLILRPIGKKRAEMEIRLSAHDSGRVLGPFPAGDYLATFGALTAIGNGNTRVTIENNATHALHYELTRDNVICGTLISALQSKDWAAGMPYQENFTIQSITLKGAGIHRKLRLLEGQDVNMLDHYIPRVDFYYKGNFFFFGLPAGDFELTIRAQGYKPFAERCSIRAGRPFGPLVVELTPE